MEKTDKLLAINQTLPGLEQFLREVLGNEGLSLDAEEQRQEFLKRLETVTSPPALPPRPTRLAARTQNLNDSGSGKLEDEEDSLTNSLYRNDTIDINDPVAFASHQRELSRHYTFSKAGYVGRRELLGESSPLYSTQALVTQPAPGYRNSIQSCSSDEIYERLSIGEAFRPGESTSDISDIVGIDKSAPDLTSTSLSSIGQQGATGRGSGGKGKTTTGWFKKEAKPQTEVYLSDIEAPVIQGYLRDVKSNKRRWCVLKHEKLYIFKTRDDPTNQIIDLPNCHIGVDDKKKISYSFRLQQTGAPAVQLAIEEGHDLSPWMSAIMAAAVRRSETYRPTSPLDNTCSLEEAQGKFRSPYGYMRIDIRQDEEEDGRSSTYEVPLELLPEMMSSSGYLPYTSTPTSTQPETENHGTYNPPLPSLPLNSDSSSDSSSDEEVNYNDSKGTIQSRKERKTSRVTYKEDNEKDTKTTDSTSKEKRCSFNDDSHGTDSPSDQSTHRLSYGEAMASDEACEPRGERLGSLQRKRTSTVLSNVSLDSAGSNPEQVPKDQHPPRKSSITFGPRMKRRRKQTTAENEAKFLQDPSAHHSGILFQRRPLGVWSKRYCKLIADHLVCYRHADDEKPFLSIILTDQDVTLTDSKESRKAYAFKVGLPGQESYYFATDSRVSVERWIEVLSLAATGRQDIMAPYPPYFKSYSGDERFKSRESLSLSEDIDSGDTLDFVDSTNTCISRGDGCSYDDVSAFAADELDEDVSSDAREDHSTRPKNHSRRVKSPNRRSPRHHTNKGGVRDRAMKRKKEKQSSKASGTESPYAMSPPQSVFVSDSGGENRPIGTDEASPTTTTENRVSGGDSKKDKKGWAESLKLKQSRFTRGHSLSAIITGTTGNPASELSKAKLQAIKKSNIQSYTHLLSLLDKEGRLSGFLTEVKVSKYSRTQLRRWCVVKNGALNLFNKQMEETPAVKLNLAEMWLTESHEETKNKYSFDLHGKDEKTYTFQVPSKEEFDKWYGVLRVFTEIRVERPLQSSTAEETEKAPQQDRGGGPRKERPVSRGKDDGASVNTFVKRPSIRMKLSQKVNVMDIFKRSQSSYDFENPNPGDIIPTDDIKCINFTGGQLTEVCVTDDHYTWSRARWCTIKDSELLIFADSYGGDPVKRIILYNVRIEEACELDNEVYRFKLHKAGDTLIFVANSKVDYERWVSQLISATTSYGKGDHENSKCKIPSPHFFSHRRTRSETLPQVLGGSSTSGLSSSASSPEKRLSYGSASISTGSEGSTDTLMNGHLEEVVLDKKGKNTSTWCVVTSEFFFQYDSEDVTSPSRQWRLSEVKLREDNKDASSNGFGFSLQCKGKTISFQHTNQEVILQWLSVLYRYCKPTDDNTSPVLPRQDSGRYKPKLSLSHDNIKTASPDQERRFLRKTFSEGKASGRKLLRKISEDNLLHKYRRAEVFKVPWKGSLEKLNVKFRDRAEPHVNARDLERRFSCGSIFDSEGKYSGFLVELVTRPLCRSELRRWCVIRDECFYVYEQPRVETPRRVLQLRHVQLINEGKMEENIFLFRLDCGADESVVFKATNRTDFEKWVTAISVKLAVLKSRTERQEQRRGCVIDEDEELYHPESTALPTTTLTSLTATSPGSDVNSPPGNTERLGLHPRTQSNVSNDSVFIRDQATPGNSASDETRNNVVNGADNPSSVRDQDNATRRDETISGISEGVQKITLGDTAEALGDVINIGSVKVPWSAVVAETEEEAQEELDNEPIYQNTGSSGGGSGDLGEPIYQNKLEVISEGNTATLSQFQVEQIDLNSHEGRMNYRRFKEGFLANPDESMFVDMLPKRNSEYDLGPLYDNLHFLAKEEPQGKPLWSVRSKDYDEVFASNIQTSVKYRKASSDRRSMASDYSGIVGESLLEEVGSVSGNTSRSGTLSSQNSGIDPRDLELMDSAFDKELLGDILGLPVTSEEAAEISEFCTKCDEEQDSVMSGDTRSNTLTNRLSKSDVFFDASSEFENRLNPTSDLTQFGRGLGSSSGVSVQDTYFGRSSSEDEDSNQGFRTAESSPCHRPLSSTINRNLISEAQTRLLQSDSKGEVNNVNRGSRGELSEDETYITYFGRSPESEGQLDQLAQLKEDDESIVSVGAVLPSGFFSAQSSFDHHLDNSKTVNKQSSNQSTDQCPISQNVMTNSNTETANLRNKSGKVDTTARNELTKSQVELIKAVTDAFQDITSISVEDNESENTKL